jgi:long-chain fatty acid transport protein
MPTPARSLLAAVGLLALAAPSARASGFSIYEQGGRSMGFSGAYTAVTDDPSAIFHNAAGIAFLEGKQLYGGGTLVMPRSSFAGSDPFPGLGIQENQQVGVIPVPALYFTHRVSSRFAWGVGLHAPYGLKTKWANPDEFTGRYIAVESGLSGFALNPTVAYRVHDKVSLGAGLDVRFSKVRLERRSGLVNPFTQTVTDTAEVVLDSDLATALGWNVGVVVKPSPGLSVGAHYRHEVRVDYEGGSTFTQIPTGDPQLDALVASRLPPNPAVETAIAYPSILAVGVARDWTEWTVAADLVFFGWESFDQLELTFPSQPELDTVIPENYENIWQFRTGVERRLDDGWAVRLGYHYDKTPVPTESVSPLLPDNDRHGFSLGGSWASPGGRIRVDVGAWYLFLAKRSTEGRNRDGYDGTYDNGAFTFGASLGYRF